MEKMIGRIHRIIDDYICQQMVAVT